MSVEKLQIAPGQFSEFDLSWAKVQVFANRLTVETMRTPYIRIVDLILKTLREASGDYLVSAMGINRYGHYKCGSLRDRDLLGQNLVPPSSWGPWGASIAQDIENEAGDARHGGMIHATMRQYVINDRPNGWIEVKVEPSPDIPGNVGVAVHVNDHYDGNTANKDDSRLTPKQLTEALLTILENDFDRSIQRAEEIVAGILDKHA